MAAENIQPENLPQLSVSDFAAATASKQPAPGGGSVAAVVASLASALGEMSVAFSSGSKKFADKLDQLNAAAAKLAKARELFLTLAVEDAQAFSMYEQCAQLSEDQRDQQKKLAIALCINVPREMAKLSLSVLQLLAELADITTRWLISDLAAAAILAESAVRLADLNIRINASTMDDRSQAAELLDASDSDCKRAAELMTAVHQKAKSAISGK